MWPARAAILPIPSHAVVPRDAVEAVESDFATDEDLETRIDRAFAQLDQRQPALARYIAREIEPLHDETAQALGHYLGVAVHEAFVNAFGPRVGPVGDADLDHANASLEADEELRRESPDEVLESDDVLAIAQPHLLGFVREQLESALDGSDEDDDAQGEETATEAASEIDLDAVAGIYRAILVEIMALSRAVAHPPGAKQGIFLA